MSIINKFINRLSHLSPANRLRYLVQILALIPLAILILDFVQNNLTANPIQAAIQRTGLTAIILLAFSLSITPLNIIFQQSIVKPLRRTFGLNAFFYALVHVTLYTVVDYGLDLKVIFSNIAEQPFLIAGLIGFMVMVVLAITSLKVLIKKLGKNWKLIHMLIYPTSLILGLHFAWALKGDLFRLSGDIFWPVLYLSYIIVLLVIRIPIVKQLFAKKSNRLAQKDSPAEEHKKRMVSD